MVQWERSGMGGGSLLVFSFEVKTLRGERCEGGRVKRVTGGRDAHTPCYQAEPMKDPMNCW
jgi:hypothetical protein